MYHLNRGTLSEIEGEIDLNAPRASRRTNASTLKSMITAVNGSVQAFKELGDGIPTPPLSPGQKDEEGYLYNVEDNERLSTIVAERDTLGKRRQGFRDRKSIFGMIQTRAAQLLSDLNERDQSLKIKAICGYDGRVGLNEPEFLEWRDSEEGTKALKSGELLSSDDEICQGKKNCDKHRDWRKVEDEFQLSEIHEIKGSIKRLNEEERRIREEAKMRAIHAQAILGGREGRVERVSRGVYRIV
jgi:hypothetical protein